MAKLKAATSSIGSSLSEVLSGSDASGGIRLADTSSSSRSIATGGGTPQKPARAPGGDMPKGSPAASSHGTPAAGSVHIDVAGSASDAETIFVDDQSAVEKDLGTASGNLHQKAEKNVCKTGGYATHSTSLSSSSSLGVRAQQQQQQPAEQQQTSQQQRTQKSGHGGGGVGKGKGGASNAVSATRPTTLGETLLRDTRKSVSSRGDGPTDGSGDRESRGAVERGLGTIGKQRSASLGDQVLLPLRGVDPRAAPIPPVSYTHLTLPTNREV